MSEKSGKFYVIIYLIKKLKQCPVRYIIIKTNKKCVIQSNQNNIEKNKRLIYKLCSQ